LSIANSIWMQKGHPWKEEYLARTRGNFRASLLDADFTRDPEAARGRINKWAEKETRSRIQDLVPSGAIDRDTRMALANAIYFKAKWVNRVEGKNTETGALILTAGTTVKASLMYQKGEYWLWEEERVGLQALQLPYHGDVSMSVLPPRAPDGLPALEQHL